LPGCINLFTEIIRWLTSSPWPLYFTQTFRWLAPSPKIILWSQPTEGLSKIERPG
jgi:hypothetical protein